MKKIGWPLVLCLVAIIGIAGCNKKQTETPTAEKAVAATAETAAKVETAAKDTAKDVKKAAPESPAKTSEQPK